MADDRLKEAMDALVGSTRRRNRTIVAFMVVWVVLQAVNTVAMFMK